MKKSVGQIAEWLNIQNQTFQDVIVTGVSIDTRTIQVGDLFVPFRGEAVNGHRFVQQAFEKGAAASLWLKDEPNPPSDVPLIFVDDSEIALQEMARKYRSEHKATFIGITGSNGKTSTKDILAGTLARYFKVQKTIGNFNNQLGLPITILQLDEDTEVSVLEMGMSGFGEIELLTEISQPHYAIITNIGEAHMQDLGSRAGIAKAKFEIVKGLHSNGCLFYDGDEPLLKELVCSSGVKAVAAGFGNDNKLVASNVVTSAKGSNFNVTGALEGEYFISVLGEHQVKNTLFAMLVGQALGLTAEQIKASLSEVVLTDMRMQLSDGYNGSLYINDAYNAAPTSMRAAIQFLKTSTIRPRKWLVLGDMLELGDDEKRMHEEIADLIDEASFERVLLFGKRMGWMKEKLVQHFATEHIVYSETDYKPLIEAITASANEDVIVLFKGSRGMKLETIIQETLK